MKWFVVVFFQDGFFFHLLYKTSIPGGLPTNCQPGQILLSFFFPFTFPVRYISSWRSHGKNRWFWSSNSEVTMEWIPPVWTVVWIYSMDGRWREYFSNCSPKLHNPFCKEKNISNIFRMEINTWLCWEEAFLMYSGIITPDGIIGNLLLSIQDFILSLNIWVQSCLMFFSIISIPLISVID